jgi:hypothetical protein
MSHTINSIIKQKAYKTINVNGANVEIFSICALCWVCVIFFARVGYVLYSLHKLGMFYIHCMGANSPHVGVRGQRP